MEIEAKFAIDGELSPTRVDGLDLGPYSLSSTGVEEHRDTLLDTASRRITSQLHAVRIRAIGSALLLTLKGPNSGEGGVHVRQEWEAPLNPPISLDYGAWPEPIASRVAALAHGEALTPLLTIAVQRHVWAVKRGSRVIGELALDNGVILAGGRREPIHELEMELKGSGARNDMEALRTLLLDQAPITPELKSKLERGMALLQHARWSIDGYSSLYAVARHYVRQQLRALQRAENAVIEHGDPDAIHDQRVAIRRLRTILLELESIDVFRIRRLQRMRDGLRGAARALGAVRDLDIMLELIAAHESSSADGEQDGVANALSGFKRDLRAQRDQVYEDARTLIQQRKYRSTLERLRRFDVEKEPEGAPGQCALVRDYAGGALWGRYEALTHLEPAIDLGDTLGMHQARIAAKRLRYTIELFAPALHKRLEPARRALVALQDGIGAHHDMIVTMQTLARLANGDEALTGLARLSQEFEIEQARLLDEARASWRPLASEHMRQLIALGIAAL